MITGFEHGTGDERGTLAERRPEIELGSLCERRPEIEPRTTVLRMIQEESPQVEHPMPGIRDHGHRERTQAGKCDRNIPAGGENHSPGDGMYYSVRKTPV